MIAAITGGLGFIGRRLVEAHLSSSGQVRLLVRNRARALEMFGQRVEILEGDLAHSSAPLAAFVSGADVVYHCAAEVRSVALMKAVNFEATERLLDASAGRAGRLVLLSSTGVYGPLREGVIDETAPFAPRTLYEVTKAAADRAVQEAHAIGRLRTAVVRPSIVFGPDMPNASLRQWTHAIRRRIFFFIGAAGASANYLPVESLVEALLLCGSSDAALGGSFNVNEHTTLEQFVDWIARECGVSPPRYRLPSGPVYVAAALLERFPGWPLRRSRVSALTSRVRYDQSRLQALGYRSPIRLEAAVRQSVRAFLLERP